MVARGPRRAFFRWAILRSSDLRQFRRGCPKSSGVFARPPTQSYRAKPDALVIIDSPEFSHRVAQQRSRPCTLDPDRRLCLSLGMGVAPRPRARHARLCGPRARAAAVRAESRWTNSAARRAPLLAIRWPNMLASCVRMIWKNGCALADPPLLLVMPGSRTGEIRRMAPVFGATIARVIEQYGAVEDGGAGSAETVRSGSRCGRGVAGSSARHRG